MKNRLQFFISRDLPLQFSFLFLVLISILFVWYFHKIYQTNKICPLGLSCSYGLNCPHKNMQLDLSCKGKTCYTSL